MLILIIAGGPDKGRIYELVDHKAVVLGREGADIEFTDVKVSRRHARLWADGGRWYIQDLESRHGTHRNHQPIEDVQPLKDGDYLQIGRTVMVVARMSAEAAERADLLGGIAAGRSGSKLKRRHLVAATAAAAVILLGLNIASFLNTSRSARQIAELQQQAPRQQEALRGEVRLALDHKSQFERRLETMIAAFGPRNDKLVPKLDTILAALESQPDVAGPLTALAQAIEERDAAPQLSAKIDSALALLEERGGDAEALAEQFRVMLAEQPTVEQIAAATRQHNEQTVAVLGGIAGQLDQLAAGGVAGADLSSKLAELRQLIEQRPAQSPETAGARQLKPLLEQVLARVETLDAAEDMQAVLTAIAEVKSALPADNSAKLDAMLAQVALQPTGRDFDQVNERLASLTAELRDRRDTQLIQTQLAAFIEAHTPGTTPGTAPGMIPGDDPLLGQILAQVQALAEQDKKLDAIVASLAQQPYENRAIMQEALAAAGDGSSQQVIAAMLDKTMAELRGKSITDADELRRLIQREVVAAVGKANGQPTPRRGDDTRLTKTETAYKLAFESQQKVTIGAGVTNPVTGQVSAGRTLDPAVAEAEGFRTWRDWYLMDDLSNRMQAEQAATRYAERTGSRPSRLSIPGDPGGGGEGGVTVNAAPLPE